MVSILHGVNEEELVTVNDKIPICEKGTDKTSVQNILTERTATEARDVDDSDSTISTSHLQPSGFFNSSDYLTGFSEAYDR